MCVSVGEKGKKCLNLPKSGGEAGFAGLHMDAVFLGLILSPVPGPLVDVFVHLWAMFSSIPGPFFDVLFFPGPFFDVLVLPWSLG